MVYITSVEQETRIYKSLQGSNLNQNPLTETAYWERLTTNYESLLNELKNNDTEVLCTIKPTAEGETYYYGNGVLTSLSASITQGDKATFSGSFEGSGELSAICDEYGSELYDHSNAIADPNGSEANATTGWTDVGLNGTGANVFESQSSVVNEGTYAFHFNSNDTPTSGARLYIDLEALGISVDDEVKIEIDVRHIGTGGTWTVTRAQQTNLTSGETSIQDISVGETTFQTIEVEYTQTANTRYFGFREASGTNNGGLYVDNLSIKVKV